MHSSGYAHNSFHSLWHVPQHLMLMLKCLLDYFSHHDINNFTWQGDCLVPHGSLAFRTLANRYSRNNFWINTWTRSIIPKIFFFTVKLLISRRKIGTSHKQLLQPKKSCVRNNFYLHLLQSLKWIWNQLLVPMSTAKKAKVINKSTTMLCFSRQSYIFFYFSSTCRYSIGNEMFAALSVVLQLLAQIALIRFFISFL